MTQNDEQEGKAIGKVRYQWGSFPESHILNTPVIWIYSRNHKEDRSKGLIISIKDRGFPKRRINYFQLPSFMQGKIMVHLAKGTDGYVIIDKGKTNPNVILPVSIINGTKKQIEDQQFPISPF